MRKPMSRQVVLSAYQVLDSLDNMIEEILKAQKDEILIGPKKQLMDQTLQRVHSYQSKIQELYGRLIQNFGDPFSGIDFTGNEGTIIGK